MKKRVWQLTVVYKDGHKKIFSTVFPVALRVAWELRKKEVESVVYCKLKTKPIDN